MKNKYFKYFAKIILVFSLVYSSSVSALTNVDITRGNIEPVPIALPKFQSNDRSMAAKVREVVISDLEGTGLIRIIDEQSYIDEEARLNKAQDFVSWRQINAAALALGKIDFGGNGHANAALKMWDVFSQKETLDKTLSDSEKNWRALAHKIADEIYKKLTGEKGYFNTKIVYVAVGVDNRNKKVRRIAIMDQDGANHSYLTDGRNIVLTPRFAPDSKSILYLSYKDMLKPKIYLMDIRSKSSRSLGEFQGMSYAPRYTPDGKKALLSVEQMGVSNIYMLDLATMSSRKITNCSSICVSPYSSPKQDKIVFNSDMGGSGQLYVMNFDGSGAHRISFGEGTYSSPVWSPRGDLIAFTKLVPGEGFYIGVMKPDGSSERIITRGWLVEGPTWSPNGRVLMFEKQSSHRDEVQLHTIDITGNNERVIETKFGATDASWSNLLS